MRNPFIIFLTGILAHIFTIPVPISPHFLFGPYNTTFVYDDVVAIERNPFIYNSDTSWLELFTTRDFWGNHLAWASSHKSYRPITSFTYRLQVLWDGNGIHSVSVKRSLHAFNVLTFGLVCVFFYNICTQLEDVTRRNNQNKEKDKSATTTTTTTTKLKQNTYIFSMLAGLIFAVHPVHTEAVACLVGRCEILSGLFFLMSLSAHITSTKSTTRWAIVCWHVAAATTAFASMLCKEQGVTVLAVWIMYDVLQITTKYISSKSTKSFIGWVQEVLWNTLPFHFSTIFLLMLALYFRLWMSGHYAPIVFTKAENPASVEKDVVVRCLTLIYINCYNLWILLVPYSLCCDWALDSIPLVTSLTDSRLVTPVSMIFLLIQSIHYFIRQAMIVSKKQNKKNKNKNEQMENQKEHQNQKQLNTSNTTNNENDTNNDNNGDNENNEDDENNENNENNGNELNENVLNPLLKITDSNDSTGSNNSNNSNVPLLGLFGLLLMIVVFIPAMNIFFYVGFVIAERVLFLPSMGYSMFIAALLTHLNTTSSTTSSTTTTATTATTATTPRSTISTKSIDASSATSSISSSTSSQQHYHSLQTNSSPNSSFNFSFTSISTSMSNPSSVLSLVLVLLYFLKSIHRNVQWRNDITMMRNEIWTNPNNARLHHGLGVALHSAGKELEAIASFEEAWRLWPGYNEPMNFIGVVKKNRNDRMGALQAYRLALKETPEFTKSLFNLGALLVSNVKVERQESHGNQNQTQNQTRTVITHVLNQNVTELNEACDGKFGFLIKKINNQTKKKKFIDRTLFLFQFIVFFFFLRYFFKSKSQNNVTTNKFSIQCISNFLDSF